MPPPCEHAMLAAVTTRTALRIAVVLMGALGMACVGGESTPRQGELPAASEWPVALVQPLCEDGGDCAAAFDIGRVGYTLSCAKIRSEEVSERVVATGTFDFEEVSAHVIHGVDPSVMVAVRMEATPCRLEQPEGHAWQMATSAHAERSLADRELEEMRCRILARGSNPPDFTENC